MKKINNSQQIAQVCCVFASLLVILGLAVGCIAVHRADTIDFDDEHIDYSDFPYHG